MTRGRTPAERLVGRRGPSAWRVFTWVVAALVLLGLALFIAQVVRYS